MGHHTSVLTYTMGIVEDKEKGKEKKKRRRNNNGWKLPECDKRHKSIHSRSSTNPRMNQCKDTHTNNIHDTQIFGS